VLVLAGCGSTPGPAPTASGVATGYRPHSIAVSTTAGDVIASAEVFPEADSVIEGHGADGTAYRLEIPAFAVLRPVTISIRPLAPVDIQGGRVVAGAALEPAGTRFALPVTLTISPAAGAPKGVIPLQYSGDAGAATATLGTVRSIDAASVSVSLAHFSGTVMASISDGSAANWSNVVPLPANATPADTIAYAEAKLNAMRFDQITSLDQDPDTYDARANAVLTQWIDAEDAIWKAAHPEAPDRAAAGLVADAADFLETVNELLIAARSTARDEQLVGDPSDASQAAAESLLDRLETFMLSYAKNLETDTAFQKALHNGLESDYDSVDEVLVRLGNAARQQELRGHDETGLALEAAARDFAHTYGIALAASCLKVPIRRDLAERMRRNAQVAGDSDLETAMQRCMDAYDQAYPSGPASAPPSAPPTAQPTTLVSGWKSEHLEGPDTYHGLKCHGLGGAWVIKGKDTGGGLTQDSTFTVTIDGTSLDGVYDYHAIQVFASGNGDLHGTGDATIAFLPDGSVAMDLGETKVTSTVSAGGGTATSVLTLPGWTFLWLPVKGNECP
jgi:hypothetical protein